jgi:two-component system alkaline phosphatase synthesis response regulator PhoP
MMAAARRILLVEDDESMVVALRDGLAFEGFDVAVAADGEAGLRLAAAEPPALVILDVMLPRKSGLDVCRELRERGIDVPILMLTARGQEIDKVLGSSSVPTTTSPSRSASWSSWRASKRSCAARAVAAPAATACGSVTCASTSAPAKCAAATGPLELSARELRLLRYFVDHRGEILTREQLLTAVWDYDEPPLTRTVDMHVAKLRKKLEDGSQSPSLIATVHRQGYKFTA